MSPQEELDLLTRFAPELHFDALERWRPGSATPYMDGSLFFSGDDLPVESSPPAGQAILDHSTDPKSKLNPLDEKPDHDTQLRSNLVLRAYGREQDLAGAGSCYGRVIDADEAVFLQYWLFYADNPCVLPPGRHDGDWELVQVRLQRTRNQIAATHVTIAAHGKPLTERVEPDVERAEVFVAVDSHASYLKAGAHPMVPLSDVCDPGGTPGSVPSVVPLPLDEAELDWAHWAGRWGMNGGAGTWLALWLRMKRTPSFMRRLNIGAGESPPSPARQGASWDSPKLFTLRGSQRRVTNGSLQRLAHFIGRLTWPRQLPAVTVTRVAPKSFVIDAKPAGHFARRVTMVSVAFEEENEDTPGARHPLARYSVRTGQPAGPIEIEHDGPLYWRAAGYNFLRQRGEPTARNQPLQVPWPLKVWGTSSDDQGARRVFEGTLTGHLRRRGATSKDGLVGSAGWFWLRLNEKEVERVINAARRDGLVAPLGQSRDAAGMPIGDDEWALTDRGREHERTRALSFRDSVASIRGVGKPVVSGAEKWGKRAAATVAPFLPFLALGSGLNISIAIAIVATGAILALSLGTGLRGETELRRAAEHWPRLRTCRPNIHAWQTTSWRPWERVPIAAAAALYLLASAAVLRGSETWEFNIWIAAAIGVAAAAIAWWRLGRVWRRWLSLNKAFREERDRVYRLRRKAPGDRCAWGHACDAAEGNTTTSCPRFGPDAPSEEERIPAIV